MMQKRLEQTAPTSKPQLLTLLAKHNPATTYPPSQSEYKRIKKHQLDNPKAKFNWRFYPINLLQDFYDKHIQGKKEEMDGEGIPARFIATLTGELRLAKEGRAPAHIWMSCDKLGDEPKNVLSAGRVYFVQGAKGPIISKIDANSGGYHADFSSIIWALSILHDSGVKFAETITLHDLYKSGKIEKVSLEDLNNTIKKQHTLAIKTKGNNDRKAPIVLEKKAEGTQQRARPSLASRFSAMSDDDSPHSPPDSKPAHHRSGRSSYSSFSTFLASRASTPYYAGRSSLDSPPSSPSSASTESDLSSPSISSSCGSPSIPSPLSDFSLFSPTRLPASPTTSISSSDIEGYGLPTSSNKRKKGANKENIGERMLKKAKGDTEQEELDQTPLQQQSAAPTARMLF